MFISCCKTQSKIQFSLTKTRGCELIFDGHYVRCNGKSHLLSGYADSYWPINAKTPNLLFAHANRLMRAKIVIMGKKK